MTENNWKHLHRQSSAAHVGIEFKSEVFEGDAAPSGYMGNYNSVTMASLPPPSPPLLHTVIMSLWIIKVWLKDTSMWHKFLVRLEHYWPPWAACAFFPFYLLLHTSALSSLDRARFPPGSGASHLENLCSPPAVVTCQSCKIVISGLFSLLQCCRMSCFLHLYYNKFIVVNEQ